MNLIPFLICFPFVVAALLAVIKDGTIRGYVVYAGSGIIMLLDAIVIGTWIANPGYRDVYYCPHWVSLLILAAEIALMIFVVVVCVKKKRYFPAILSFVQTMLVAWVELFGPELAHAPNIALDRFSVLMTVIIAFIGGLICIYAVGYMRGYHIHHKEVPERKNIFFCLLFTFLGAMFGLVLSSSLLWMGFFWEVTSVCSFLLIGYTKTEEAVNNSFRALWMNLLGGLGFAIAIFYCSTNLGTVSLQTVVQSGAMLPVTLLAFAGLTKSAQMPFSTWLLGAMVAPTPSSALLHSATMVKAGVYLLLRLAPAMRGTMTGTLVAFIGGFTFLSASLLAISQSDGKKVLAYSTISNLGLITACAGVGYEATVWAALFLILFHAVSKSMLFQDIGAVENAIGSRDIEDMQSLIMRQPFLAYIMVIGIAGMFLAPFGMLVSKWAALKAFVDSGNMILVLFVVFGSATTMFYWTKWLCKLVGFNKPLKQKDANVKRPQEYTSLAIHASLMIGLCLTFPILSTELIEPLIRQLYANPAVTVLAASDLLIMITLLVSVIIFPVVLFFAAKHIHGKKVLSYMGGINTGDNNSFVDSFGEKQDLFIANWYMEPYFGESKLLPASQIVAIAVILVLLCMIMLGGLR